jgi:hypothetical protein
VAAYTRAWSNRDSSSYGGSDSAPTARSGETKIWSRRRSPRVATPRVSGTSASRSPSVAGVKLGDGPLGQVHAGRRIEISHQCDRPRLLWLKLGVARSRASHVRSVGAD